MSDDLKKACERNERLLTKAIELYTAMEKEYRPSKAKEKAYWKKVFASSAICAGKTCYEAFDMADTMVKLFYEEENDETEHFDNLRTHEAQEQ